MKCILSFRVAKHLLAEGCEIVDLDTSHKYEGNVVFVFKDDEKLKEAMNTLPHKNREGK